MRWSNRRWMWDGDSGSQGTRVILGLGAPIVTIVSGYGELKSGEKDALEDLRYSITRTLLP